MRLLPTWILLPATVLGAVLGVAGLFTTNLIVDTAATLLLFVAAAGLLAQSIRLRRAHRRP